MKFGRRLFALLLCLVLSLSLFPAAAFAEDEPPQAVEIPEETAGEAAIPEETAGEAAIPEEEAAPAPEEPAIQSYAAEVKNAVVDSGACGENLTWTLDTDGVLTVFGTGEMTEAPWREEHRSDIGSVRIEDGVTTVGPSAFEGCDQLNSVSIPDSVTAIQTNAFFGCGGLSAVTLPSALTTIGDGAFFECGLTSITIPASVTGIGSSAFGSCGNLTELLTEAGSASFQSIDGILFSKDGKDLVLYPGGKTGAYTVPAGVAAIRDGAFSGCRHLTALTFPASVSEIGFFAFSWSDNLSTVTFTGHAPTFAFMSFAESSLTVCYPAGDDTWTEEVRQNYGGTITWVAAAPAKPVITTQPTSVTVAAGKTATFKVTATGSDLQYQWYYKAKPTDSWTAVKNNGTSATYTLTTAERHNGYQYRCRVKNTAGQVFTTAVTLTVGSKPVITTQPTSVTVTAGQTATFKVAASGSGLQYQWYYKAKPTDSWTAVKNNGTSATYTLTTAERHNGYQYRCRVKNTAGQVFTTAVTLTVGSKPVITTQPTSVTVAAGQTATFKVAASGSGLQYQWYYKAKPTDSWTAVKNNGTAATYTLTTAERHNGYQYRCRVKNTAGQVFTTAVTLTVGSKPVITTQPTSVTVAAGQTATFKVAASGSGLQYQWYYKAKPTDSWTAVKNNGTSATYTLTTAERHNGYQYRCRVKNTAGQVFTTAVTLTVEPVQAAMKIAMVTDSGPVNDGAYNQAAWTGISAFCGKHDLSCSNYVPADDSPDTLLAAIDNAVKDGANVVVCAGFTFEEVIFEAQSAYPGVQFLLLDGEPHSSDGESYVTASNTHCVIYKEEDAGFCAGYAAVKDGYTQLGFMGGMAIPAVTRYGNGFLQGANAAAKELGITGQVSVKFWYCNQFFPSDEVQETLAGWYAAGTQVVFAAAGGACMSAVDAAEGAGGKVIGVDMDQSGLSDCVLTSAVKDIQGSVAVSLEDLWNNNGVWSAACAGKTSRLGAGEGGAGLPTAAGSWRFRGFTVEAYNALLQKVANGTIQISDSTSAPAVSISVEYLN